MMGRADEEGVAVRSRFCSRRRTDRAACAAAILDDDALAELLVELRRQRAREGVGAAAGREGHDEGNRPLRPGLGLNRPRGGQKEPCGRTERNQAT